MRSVRAVFACAVAALAITGSASADTVATFADPSPTGATPLFSLTGNTLTGGWSGLGLLLQTPGLPSVGDFADATFAMTPLTATNVFGPFFVTSAGAITFRDSANALLLQITFDAGVLSMPLSFGASDQFFGHNVVFSGPILNGLTVASEQFSFSFANPASIEGGMSATSSFTSSADLRIPGPASLAVMGAGLLVSSRRKRA